MQSQDDHMLSPYSTPSFNSSFGAQTSDPQPAPSFHRYQQGDLAAPWYATSSPEQNVPNGNIRTSPLQQSFQVLGPYMMAEPAIYGQPVAYNPGPVTNQQIQAHFPPGMADPRTPAPSPSNSSVPGGYYQNSPAATYPAQHSVSAAVPTMPYNSPAPIGHAADYSASREGHRGSLPTLYKTGSTTSLNNSTSSLDSMASNSYPPGPNQTGPQTYTFVASEASSFTFDSGSQPRAQKAAKKRGTVTATRRPRKPPPETVADPKLQTSPEISRNAPRAGSPKRARTEVSQSESQTLGEQTPDSSRTVSPGTISKAHIGQRSRASTDASQPSDTGTHGAGQPTQDSGAPQPRQPESSQFLGQAPWAQELMEESQTLMKRVEEFCRLGTQLRKDIKRYERDVKGKLLEMPTSSAGDAVRDDSPQAGLK